MRAVQPLDVLALSRDVLAVDLHQHVAAFGGLRPHRGDDLGRVVGGGGADGDLRGVRQRYVRTSRMAPSQSWWYLRVSVIIRPRRALSIGGRTGTGHGRAVDEPGQAGLGRSPLTERNEKASPAIGVLPLTRRHPNPRWGAWEGGSRAPARAHPAGYFIAAVATVGSRPRLAAGPPCPAFPDALLNLRCRDRLSRGKASCWTRRANERDEPARPR